MRKRILLVTLLVSVLGIVLLSVLFSDVFYRQSIEAVNGQLQIYMDVYAAERQDDPLDGAGAEAFAAELRGVRVTFLSADGAVLGDSEADASAMENHASREEVAEALASGEGSAVRDSATLGYDSVYYCRAFEREGQTYLVRLATQADSGIAIFVDALPTVLLLLAVDILVCLLVAWLATSFILRPVEKLTRAAASSGGREVHTPYPELQPLAKMMNDMNAEIGAQLARIREDRSIEKLVLNSMEHGIVIFRSDEDVLLINRTARYLLGYEKNEPIACFAEDAEIAAVLAAGEPAALARRIGEREYSFRFTFEKPANVLLITDMTDIMAAARSKNDFIANVTHEMNTPLTSIRGFAELIGAGAIPPEKLAGVADTIIRQSDRLSRLIRSIINFSAIDSDDLPDYEVDLTEIVRELAGNFEPSLRQKGIPDRNRARARGQFRALPAPKGHLLHAGSGGGGQSPLPPRAVGRDPQQPHLQRHPLQQGRREPRRPPCGRRRARALRVRYGHRHLEGKPKPHLRPLLHRRQVAQRRGRRVRAGARHRQKAVPPRGLEALRRERGRRRHHLHHRILPQKIAER